LGFVTKEPKASELFKDSVEELKLFLTSRKEDRATFGEIVAFLKTPSQIEVVSISPGE
jgi:hypothetical protein